MVWLNMRGRGRVEGPAADPAMEVDGGVVEDNRWWAWPPLVGGGEEGGMRVLHVGGGEEEDGRSLLKALCLVLVISDNA
jgi:hypothetical protein